MMRISLNGLLDVNANKREYLSWQIAHQVVEIVKREGKAIVVENLEKIPKGKRGDGMLKLRQKLQKWIYKGMLEKIEVMCKRNGVQVLVARVEDRIAKLKKERNKLKSELRRLKRRLKLLLKFLLDSGKSESATQQVVNHEMKPIRGPTRVGQKSWRVLSVAFAFSCLESFRGFSPLKRVILIGDWVGVACRVNPSSWSGDGCTKYVQFCIVWVARCPQ